MNWDKATEEKFEQLLEKIPSFLRNTAREKVSTKAESLAKGESRSQIIEKDLVNACFEETPFGFHGPMKVDMESLGIDYIQYGHEK